MPVPSFVRCGCAALLLLAPMAVRAQASADSAGVMRSLETMLNAMRQRNVDGLRSIFHEQARMTLLRPAPTGGMRAMVLTGSRAGGRT